jgi:hypothetical protein
MKIEIVLAPSDIQGFEKNGDSKCQMKLLECSRG